MIAAITPQYWLVIVAAVCACYTDLKSGRIPNVLTFSLLLVGLAANAISGQLWLGLLGLLFAFAVHFLLWGLGVEKGGDAKFMMALGASVGWVEMIEASLLLYVLFLPVGIAVLALRGNLMNFVLIILWGFNTALGREAGKAPKTTSMPFAPVILVASIGAALINFLHVSG